MSDVFARYRYKASACSTGLVRQPVTSIHDIKASRP